MRLYLQNIVDDISFDNLPAKWQGFDFARFSKDKTLFDFHKHGLQNVLKGLWLYFKHSSNSSTRGKYTPYYRDTPLREGNCEVEFEDGTKINTRDLDYKFIKPLICWEG